GSARCTGLKLLENGAATNTSVSTSGSTFSATVTLAPGSDSIVATCTSPDGTTLRSEPILWHERLPAGPTAQITVSTRGREVLLSGARSEPGAPQGARIVGYRWHSDPRH